MELDWEWVTLLLGGAGILALLEAWNHYVEHRWPKNHDEEATWEPDH